ncbi:CapA family protein [Aquibacillus rhizosphaerae]
MKPFLLALCTFLIVLVSACGEEEEIVNDETTSPSDQSGEISQETELDDSKEQEEVVNPEPEVKEITIAAIGDLLIHDTVYEDAKTKKGYDFTPMLEKVKPYLNKTDITVANQETMIGGEDLGLSSYPTFNSPYEMGDALHDVGIDVVSIANNHTLDRGEKAIQRAIEHWETIDMMYTGAYKNQEDSQEVRIMKTEEDIDVGFLSYTYGTNGIPIPTGKDYLVNLIDKDKIKSDIEMAKKQADVIILSLHFGNEYERMPSQEQKDLVQYVADLGVDVVLGHHPHVLQPVDWVEGKDGNKTLVAYSLGNFLSGQDEFYRRIGGVVSFTIEKTTEGEQDNFEVKSPKFLPTFVDFNMDDWNDYKVIPMYQLTEDELTNVDMHYEEIKAHMSQWIPDLEFIESE